MCRGFNITDEKRWYSALGLLLLFAVYYGAVVGFMHSHITDEGIITHSHPYSSSSHTHNPDTLVLSQVLSTIVALVALSVVVPFLCISYFTKNLYTLIFNIADVYCCGDTSRAPPVLA